MKHLVGILMLSGLLLQMPIYGDAQNIALNKITKVSSVESGTSNSGYRSVDGNTGTRWSTYYADPQWIYVDLVSQYNITNVNITWATAYGKNYRIDISNDASTWTTLKSITNNTSLTNNNAVTGTGRYVRIYGTARGTTSNYSISEIVINGSATSGGGGTSCGIPTGLSSSSIATTSATISWTAVSGATKYNFQWKASSSSTWTTVSGATGTSYNITGLTAGTTYQFQVQTVCSSGTSSYSSTSFTTTSGTTSCGTPTGLSSSGIATTSATISWTGVSGATKYNLQWKASSSSTWTTISGTTTTSYNLTGLTAGTAYQFQVQTVCSAGTSSYSASTSFTTTASGGSSGGSTGGGNTGGSNDTGSGGITSATGKTYYFSSSTGDDSRTATQAQSSSTPWKTLSKLNSYFSSLQPGDLVLFKRGDIFYGNINVTKSGSSGAPIAFSAYGTGARPVISGFATISSSSWTSKGNGLYEATVSAGLPTLNSVTRNGAFAVMGKYPKGNTGYLTVSSGSTTSISSSGLSGIPNFAGGEIVWRPYHWVLWRGTVLSQSSSSVSFTSFASTLGGSVYPAAAKYGFFFQNHPNACTSLGEWAYTPSSHKITMYFGTSGPSGNTVNVSSIENLVTLNTRSYLTFDNLGLTGANTESFSIVNSNNIKINACDITFSGHDAVNNNSGCSSISITNCFMNYSNFNAIVGGGSSGFTITGNTISNTASVAGMGGSGEGQYEAIMNVKSSVVTLNKITNTGYTPIAFSGTNNTIQNNYIDTYCFVKDDGAGIYCGGGSFTGSKVIGNIVLNGIGALTGTPDPDGRTHGIYVDDGGSNVEIGGNTVAYCQYGGLYTHNSHELNIHDNTIFANGFTGIKYYNNGNTIANITLTGNIFFAKTSSQFVSYMSGGTTSPKSYFTTANNNYWCRPISENNSFQVYINSALTNYNLASWKTYTGKETNSHTSPVTITDVSKIRFEYNATTTSKTISLGASYIDAKGITYTSITLAPFTSAVLMATAGSTAQSVANTTEIVDQTNLIEKPSLTIYPNPVTDNFVLQLNNSHMGKMDVQVVNQAGAIVRSYLFNKDQIVNQITVPAHDLPTGVYFVHVQIGTWSDKRKIVKL